ncbi:MAG TPA: hypothetical protein VIM89_07990 [Mucilaginibacter sp.]
MENNNIEKKVIQADKRPEAPKAPKKILRVVFQALGVIFLLWDLLHQSPARQVKSTIPAASDNLDNEAEQRPPEHEGNAASPHSLPKPTYWPFFLALGMTFIFWGLLTTWVILLAGFLVLATSLYGWINILRHE